VNDLSILELRVCRRCPSDRAWQRSYEIGDHFRIEVSAPTREDGFGAGYNRLELAVSWAPGRLRFSLLLMTLEVSWYYYKRPEKATDAR
jgi:hypothetical protein